MPALRNPRHEAFAQAIFRGLSSAKPNGKNTQRAAYLAAGYSPATIEAADASASKLLRKVKPILERVRELQAQALARVEPKLDISRERVGRRLDLASQKAEHEGNTANIIAAELGIAKVFGLTKIGEGYNPTDPSNAQSMEEIGRLLMQSVGATSPSQAQINLAVEANNAFVERLEAIRDEAGQTIDNDD